MKPILFHIGSLEFPSYTFMIMVGILVGTYIGVQLCKQRHLPPVYALDMAILGILAGFLGARIAHVLVEAPAYYWEKPIRFFYFWQGGFVSWGDYTAILLSWFFYLRWRKQPVWAYFDLASIVMPLTIFFGRIGCLLAGCCYGKPTDFWLHLIFTDPGSTAYHFYPNTPLHATQLYLMAHVLLLTGILFWVYKKCWRFQGQLFGLLMILYPIGRIFIEFFRGDIDRGVYFGGRISSGQIVMVIYLAVGIFLYKFFKRKVISVPT